MYTIHIYEHSTILSDLHWTTEKQTTYILWHLMNFLDLQEVMEVKANKINIQICTKTLVTSLF